MAKPVKSILRGKGGPKPELEKSKNRELEPDSGAEEQPTEFNWSGFLIPNPEKLAMFVLVLVVTAVVYVFFVTSRGVNAEGIPAIVFDFKSNLFVMMSFLVIASYFWVCYAIERKLGFARTMLPVVLPELLIVIVLMMKVQTFIPTT